MGKSKAIKVGVTDTHFAAITETETDGVTTITYGTPEVLCSTASASESPQKSDNKVYESDSLIHNKPSVSSVNVDLESRTITPANEEKILHGISAASASSASAEEYEYDPLTNTPSAWAIGWAKRRSDGKYDAIWYYYGMPSANDDSIESATEQQNTPTTKLSFSCMRSPATGKLRRRAVCADAAALTTFFSSVLPQAAS